MSCAAPRELDTLKSPHSFTPDSSYMGQYLLLLLLVLFAVALCVQSSALRNVHLHIFYSRRLMFCKAGKGLHVQQYNTLFRHWITCKLLHATLYRHIAVTAPTRSTLFDVTTVFYLSIYLFISTLRMANNVHFADHMTSQKTLDYHWHSALTTNTRYLKKTKKLYSDTIWKSNNFKCRPNKYFSFGCVVWAIAEVKRSSWHSWQWKQMLKGALWIKK